MIATLGGFIKDYRIKKRFSQQEISLRLGWKDTSRISKIEQGRVGKPNRQTAERIIKALGLNEQEKGEFLLVGGYIPSDTEIENVIKQVKNKIDDWSYPAYLMDFSSRWLYTNNHMLFVRQIPHLQKHIVKRVKPNFLLFPFLPKNENHIKIMKGEDKNNLFPYNVAQIVEFREKTDKYQNESWYKALIKELMQYDDFRKLWSVINNNSDTNRYKKKLFDYEYKLLSGIYNGKKTTLKFHSSALKVVTDPRFETVLYFPADRKTEIFSKKNFNSQ